MQADNTNGSCHSCIVYICSYFLHVCVGMHDHINRMNYLNCYIYTSMCAIILNTSGAVCIHMKQNNLQNFTTLKHILLEIEVNRDCYEVRNLLA